MTFDMPSAAAELVTVDVLPVGCGIAIEAMGTNETVEWVRVRGYDDGRASLWSGWFAYDGEPVHVTWAAFTWPRRRWWRR